MTEEEFIEIEMGDTNRTFFLRIQLSDDSIWIDTKGLPEAVLLCAMHDGKEAYLGQCGDRSQYQRVFLPANWVINEWDGDKELINTIQARIDELKADLPKLKLKHGK